MKTYKSIFFSVAVLLLLLSCCTTQGEPSKNVDEIKSQLLPDTCGIIGVISDNNGNPIEGEVVWLGEVIWNDDKSEGQFVIDGGRSPSTISDEFGNFVFQNIKVNEYVIIIGNLEVDPVILPKETNPNEAEIFYCTDGTIITVEDIIIDSSSQ